MEELVLERHRAGRIPVAGDDRRCSESARCGRPGVPECGRGRHLRRHDRAEPQRLPGQISVSFTVPASQLQQALKVARQLADEFGLPQRHGIDPQVAKLSVSGIGLRSHTGVAIRMFRALAEAKINVDMISTSEVRVNVVVDGQHGQSGLEKLQTAFADVLR